MSYYEVYKKRLNRYGNNFQERIKGQRERDFDLYLLKSIYRIDFEYDGEIHPATLEPYKQTYIDTNGYLLTKTDFQIKIGTILDLTDNNGSTNKWLVWWLENNQSSGYNRYVVLKLTNNISWVVDGEEYSQWFYFQGPGYSKISDTLKQTTGKNMYIENNNKYMLVSSRNDKIFDNLYIEIDVDGATSSFVVKEKDIVTTPGIGYYTLDPVATRNIEKINNVTETSENEISWLNQGGDEHGSTQL